MAEGPDRGEAGTMAMAFWLGRVLGVAALVASLAGAPATGSVAPAAAIEDTTAGWVPGRVIEPTWTLRDLWFVAYPNGIGGLAVGDGGTLLTTSDGGRTWTRVGSGTDEDLTVARTTGAPDFGESASFVGGPCIGLARVGVTLHVHPDPPAACTTRLVSASFSGATGALVFGDGSVRWTEDSARTLSPASPLPGTPAAGGAATPTYLWQVTPTTAVAATSDGALHRTVDAGRTWATTAVLDRPVAAIGNGPGPDELVAVGAGGLVRTSTDAGATWSSQEAVAIPLARSLTGVSCRTGALCVFTTTDSGGAAGPVLVRWEPGAPGATEVLPTGGGITVARAVTDTTVVAAGLGGTLVVSADAGRTFAPATVAAEPYSRIVTGPGGTAVALTPTGGVAVTEDRGATWTRRPAPLDSAPADAAVAAPGVLYLLTHETDLLARRAVVLRSGDAGVTWRRLDTGLPAASAAALRAPAPRTVVLLGSGGARRSTDGGVTFTRVTALPRAKRERPSGMTSSDGVIAAWSRSAAWISRDAGARWRPVPLPRSAAACLPPMGCRGVLRAPVSAIAFAGPRRLWLVGASGQVFRSGDAGRSWTWSPVPGPSVRQIESGGGVLVAGGEWGTRTSDDGGRTWWPPGIADTAWNVAPGPDGVLYAGGGPTGLQSSSSAGRSGEPSRLAIDRVRVEPGPRPHAVVSGSLAPAQEGGVTVVAVSPGSRRTPLTWAALESDGAFYARLRVEPGVWYVMAQWAGEHTGAGSPAVRLRVR